MSDVLVLGSGFAGLWAAMAAARRADELGGQLNITVISSQPFHDIRYATMKPTWRRAESRCMRCSTLSMSRTPPPT